MWQAKVCASLTATLAVLAVSTAYAKKKRSKKPKLIAQRELCDSPQWQPGGSRLACITWNDGHTGLGIRDALGDQIANASVNVSDFSWSPDGRLIVGKYRAQRGVEALFSVSSDGTGLERLQHPARVADGYLGFGKSADEIWFQAVLGATMALFSTSVDGTSRENLGVRGTLFERSSTGDLAFLRTAQDDDEVYVAIMLKSAEKPARPVGPTGFRVKTHETLFFWSPDGRWLAVRGTSTKKVVVRGCMSLMPRRKHQSSVG